MTLKTTQRCSFLLYTLLVLLAATSSSVKGFHTTTTTPAFHPRSIKTNNSVQPRHHHHAYIATNSLFPKPKTSSTTDRDLMFRLHLAPDLYVGFGTIVAASSPYVLSLFFPTFFEDNFFLPIYDGSEQAGREAEIGWKVRYATLAFALTTLVFVEVFIDPSTDIVSALRDSYIVWAIFYTEAIRKVAYEAREGIIKINRTGIQIWHALVVIVMWADVSQSPLGQSITDSIADLFT